LEKKLYEKWVKIYWLKIMVKKIDSSKLMFIALKFNDRINARDLEGLAELMTDDHIFIDNSGDVHKGKEEMVKGWNDFFTNYPDYQNIFTDVTVNESVVIMNGYSTCSNEPNLNGPSIWTAKIRDDKVSEWRVYWIDTNG
jgi:hypothetical protein